MKKINLTPEEVLSAIWCPILNNLREQCHGWTELDEDETSVQIRITDNNEKTWFRYKVRDRYFDGPNWRPTRLTDWSYDKEADIFNLGKAVEESTYFLNPLFPLTQEFTLEEAQFITNPFKALPFNNPLREDLQCWLIKWQNIFTHPTKIFPGYFLLKNISHLRKHIFKSIQILLRGKNYDYLTVVPTWWHIAKLYEYFQFSYYFKEDKICMDCLNKKLDGLHLKTRQEMSWVVMLQFWINLVEENGFQPENFNLDGKLILKDENGKLLLYPLTPERNLWKIFKL